MVDKPTGTYSLISFSYIRGYNENGNIFRNYKSELNLIFKNNTIVTGVTAKDIITDNRLRLLKNIFRHVSAKLHLLMR